MAEDIYMQFLNGSITESAASTLTESEILTGCSVAGMLKDEAISMEVREIIIKHYAAFPADQVGAGAIEWVGFALSTESGLTTLPELDDVHCIYHTYRVIRGGVATYVPALTVNDGYPPAYQFDSPLLIPHPKIYAYVQSSNASATHKVYFRIGFTYVALSGPEVMEALEVWRSPTS